MIVELTGFDVQKNEVDEKITYEYLDLNCGFNCEVGSKTPIFLKNKGTRSFSINNIRVVFEDDSFFTTDFSNAESIPGQKKLSAVYDEDQSAQFKKEFGNKSKFSARNYKDLFLCSCGAINKTPTCLACRANIETMISADPETLKKDGVYNKAVSRMNAADYETASQLFNSVIEWRDSRDLLEKCIVKKTELQVRKEQEKKRNKNLILAVSLIAAVAVVFSVVLSVVVMPSANYKKALAATDAGNYSEAYSRFFEYPDYKDTKEQIASAKEKQAEEFFQ
ncbi:MAG: hypothetical protein IK063_05920, partial [Clostridia bacterium]|nr:hypothetical protein [Clostridia bacterium]